MAKRKGLGELMGETSDPVETDPIDTTVESPEPVVEPVADVQDVTPVEPVVDPQQAAEPPPQEPTEPSGPSEFLRSLAEMGFTAQDEAAAQQAVVEAIRRQNQEITQLRQYADAGRQYNQLAQDPDFLAWQSERIRAQQQPVAEPEVPRLGPPPVDEVTLDTWRSYRREAVDADGKRTGEWEWAPNTPTAVRDAAELHAQEVAEFQRVWNTNPAQALEPFVQHQARQIVESVLADQARQQEVHQVTSQLLAENEHWLFQHDAQGQRIIDPTTRMPVPTEHGAPAIQLIEILEQNSNLSPAQIRDIALSAAVGQAAMRRPPATAPNQPAVRQPVVPPIQPAAPATPADVRARHLAKGRQPPVDRGNLPSPEETSRRPQNQRLTLGQRMALAEST